MPSAQPPHKQKPWPERLEDQASYVADPLPAAALADALSFTFYWVTRFSAAPGHAWYPQRRPYATLWLIVEGQMHVETGGEARECGPGSLVLFAPESLMSVENRSGQPVLLYSFVFNLRVWGQLDFFQLYRVPAFTAIREVESLLGPWQELVGELAGSDGLVTLAAEGWARVLIARWLRDLEAAGHLQAALQVDPRLLTALEAIEADLAGEWDPPRLAALLCLSPVRVRQLFVRALGLPPLRYVTSRRMARARTLLAGTDLGLSEIAARCGYEDPRYFRRVFLRVVGTQPTAYREQARRADPW